MALLVVGIVAVVIFFAGLVALYVWSRRSEADYTCDGPGLTDESANATRLGIALSGNSSLLGGR